MSSKSLRVWARLQKLLFYMNTIIFVETINLKRLKNKNKNFD